jgi:hypothetical protein
MKIMSNLINLNLAKFFNLLYLQRSVAVEIYVY